MHTTHEEMLISGKRGDASNDPGVGERE